jgi:hypothetical protein
MNITKVDSEIDQNITSRMKNKKEVIEVVRFLKFKN